jgi:hypothetical protein
MYYYVIYRGDFYAGYSNLTTCLDLARLFTTIQDAENHLPLDGQWGVKRVLVIVKES